MFRSIEKYCTTYLPPMPPILIGMINNADMINAKCDLSSLGSVISGGVLLSKEVTEGFLEKFLVKILQCYGLTEAVTTYVLARPKRELLFTVVSTEEKYKAKVCLDVIVQRLGDGTAAEMPSEKKPDCLK